MRNLIMFAAIPLSGCAGTTVTPVAYSNSAHGELNREGQSDDAVTGLRYYEGAHFLIVYSDGKGGVKSEVKYLPDVTQKRAIDPYAYLAKNETTLTFSNGMLVQSKAVVDETIIPKAAVSALEKVAMAMIGADVAGGESAETYLPLPQIFKIVVGTDGRLTLLGGETKIEAGANAPQAIRISAVPTKPDAAAAKEGSK